MGASTSKAARGAASRKYPTRAPGAAVSQTAQAASRPRPNASPREQGPPRDGPRDDGMAATYIVYETHQPMIYVCEPMLTQKLAARADAVDPDFSPRGFSQRLHDMGIADPNPTYSPSSTADVQPVAPSAPIFPSARHNATLSVLESRRQLQERADADLEATGQSGTHGRRFVDMRTLVDAVQLQKKGHQPTDIERRLRLEPNLLRKLGRPGVLTHISTAD